jgi:hypothetical protein
VAGAAVNSPVRSPFGSRTRHARWLGPGLVLIVLSVLAWSVVTGTVAARLAPVDPDEALKWNGDDATALVSLAERKFLAAEGEADRGAAQSLATRALIADPLEERALRLLAFAADAEADKGRARLLMDLAGRRSLRDPAVQTWLFDDRVRAGDAAGALVHADAVLRTYPDLGERLLPALAAFTDDARARAALVEILAGDPPWRSWFLHQLAQQGDQPVAAFAVLAGLQASGSPPTSDELGVYLNRLIESRQFELAYLAWIRFLPDDRVKSIPYLYNGDFRYPVSDLPFDWLILPVRGATTEIADVPGSDSDAAVHVVFANTRVAYHNVAKLLVLPPGHYRLSGEVETNDLANERGMSWRIYCAGSPAQRIGEGPRVAGTMPWQRFVLTFDVPSSGCRGQWLKLELAARTAIEQQVSGEVWYDHLSIERVTAQAAPGQD